MARRYRFLTISRVAVVLLAGFADRVLAQQPQCTIGSTGALPARAESMTELSGDLLIQCVGGVPTALGAVMPTITITVTPDQAFDLTSRILGESGGVRWTEALLLIDEPMPGAQFACTDLANACPGYGNGTGSPTYYGSGVQGASTPNNRNIFHGALNGSSMVFQVPFDPPGQGAVRTLRVTNIRTNANQFGVNDYGAEYMFLRVSITGAGMAENTRAISSSISKGLNVSLRDAAGSNEISGIVWNPLGAPVVTRVATLQFAGGFRQRTAGPVAGDVPPPPRKQDIPGVIYQSETGFYSPDLPAIPGRGNLANAGLADTGTRLMARFSGVPEGTQLYVDNKSTGTLARLTTTGTYGQGAFLVSPARSDGLSSIPVSGGSGTAVWEIIGATGFVTMGVYAIYPPGAARPNGQVLLDFAPADAPGVSNVPRFSIQGGSIPQTSCTFQITPPNTLPIEYTTTTVRVVTQAGCAWSAASQVPWLRVSARVQGSGEVSVSANYNFGPPRTGTLLVANQSVTVTQSGGSAGLPAPVIIAPLNGQAINVRGATFMWNPVAGASVYDLRLMRSETDFLYQGSIAGETSLLIDLPLFRVAIDTRFAVRACNGPPSDAGCGPFGLVGFDPFLPNTYLGSPVIRRPVNGEVLTTSTSTISWDPDPYAQAYQLYLQRDGATVLQLRLPASATSTVYSMASGNYSLRVNSCTGYLDDCLQNFVRNFRVELPPVPSGAPTITRATVTGGTLNATWSTVLGADIYRVQVVQPNSGPGGGALTVASGQTAVSMIDLAVPAGPASVFVAACNGNGCGPYSQASPINAPGPNPAGPILGTPIPGTEVAGPAALFTWSRIPGDNGSNTTYRLFVNDLGRSGTGADVHTTDNFAAVQLTSEGRRYDAVVVANPGAGQRIGPATGFQVLGPAVTQPSMVAPAHRSRVSQGNIQIGWTPAPGASKYQYFVAVRGASAPTVTGIAPGLFVLAPLRAIGGVATEYSAIVRACVGGDPYSESCTLNTENGWGPWSNAPGGPGVTNFTVVP
ncbi:MAG: hypothetical protein U0Q16_18690 [Bryobacteraceae bacterium]